MSYIVICTVSVSEGARYEGYYERATRQTFATHAEAAEYAAGISPSREPIVVPLQQPTCATCKHWRYVAAETDWGKPSGTGIGLSQWYDDHEGPVCTEHGRCQKIRHTHVRTGHSINKRSDEDLGAAQAVVVDSEEYSAWLCTLPTFGCVLHEEKDDQP